jgi:hypothetical protein
MIRRILLGSAAVLFTAATVCAGVVFVAVVRLIIGMPEVKEATRQVVQLRPWGLAFFGCTLAGFVILWFVRDGGSQPDADPGAAADRGDS